MRGPDKPINAQPISELLQPTHRELQTVLSKVNAINTLNQTMQGLLDEKLRKHCQVANLSKGILVLLVANSAVATELRYQLSDLLKKLHRNHALKHIKEIQCKVRPPARVDVERGGIPGHKNEKIAWLSAETAEVLQEMAETIEDPKLREIMLRIAGHKT